MGGGGNFRAARIFFVNISQAGIFFSVCKNFFSGLLAVHEIFSLNFPLHAFFCTSPAFLVVRPDPLGDLNRRHPPPTSSPGPSPRSKRRSEKPLAKAAKVAQKSC